MTAYPWPVQGTAGAAEFEADLPFALDEFQHEAFEALDSGHSVLVSAPTGSVKTLVAARERSTNWPELLCWTEPPASPKSYFAS